MPAQILLEDSKVNLETLNILFPYFVIVAGIVIVVGAITALSHFKTPARILRQAQQAVWEKGLSGSYKAELVSEMETVFLRPSTTRGEQINIRYVPDEMILVNRSDEPEVKYFIYFCDKEWEKRLKQKIIELLPHNIESRQ